MALVLADRVQETTTTAGTGSLTLAGAVGGFQSFAVVGNGNTCYYTIVDGTDWEVGIGTYSTSGPTLARTTVLSNSSGTTSPLSLSSTSKPVFLTYPSEKSVNLDGSGNVSALGTIASGTWQGSTVGVAYGGTGVTTSSGANSVMLRDANQNVSINRLNQSSTTTTAAGGTTTLTAASTFSQILVGTGNQTYKLPDATTLTNTTTFEFNNNATGTLTITDYANATVGTITSGGAAAIALLANGTVGGTWDVHAYIPENVTWGTNSLALSSTVITGGTWNGGTIATGYGGTGLTSYTSGGAVYANSSSTLTSGTLPITAGGTGATTVAGAQSNLNVLPLTGGTLTGSVSFAGSVYNYVDAQRLFAGSGGYNYLYTTSNGMLWRNQADSVTVASLSNTGAFNTAGAITQNGSQVLTAANYNSYAPTLTGTGASGTWNINITGSAGSASSAVTLFGSSQLYISPTNANTLNSGYGNAGDGSDIWLNYRGYGDGFSYSRNFNVGNGKGTAYIWGDGANQRVGINKGQAASYTLDVAGTIYSNTDVRAPIFYDSNDTSYYIDPASTDNAALRMRGGALFGPNVTWGAYLAVGGNGDWSTSYASVATTDGNLHLDAKSGSATYLNYYAGSNVYFGNGASGGLYAQIATSGGIPGAFYSPIYYDYSNTSYYCDPNGTSILNVVGAAGRIYTGFDAGQNYSVSCSNWFRSYGDSGWYNETYGGGIWMTDSTWVRTYNDRQFYSSTIIQAGGSVRAPIFYDSNDTAYYLDPNNYSRLLFTSVYVGQEAPGAANSSEVGLVLRGNYNSNTWAHKFHKYDNGSGVPLYISYTYAAGAWTASQGWGPGLSYTSQVFGSLGVDGNVYTPIFYDTDNTGYYANPAGTSNFYALTVNQTISGSVIGSANYLAWLGRIPAETGRSAYYPGAYTFSTFTTSSSGNPPTTYAEVLAWGGGGSGAIQIAGDWISTTNTPLFVRSLRDCCQDWSSWTAIATSGVSFTNNVDLRAPIFYDSNNTGYYTDPASTSNIYDLTISGASNKYLFINPGNGYEAMVRYNGGTGSSWYVGKRVVSQLVDASDFHFYSQAASATVAGVDTAGNFYALASSRATTFYDSNDTTYYVDPSGFTNLYGGIQNSGAHGSSWIQNRLLAGNNGAATGEVQLRMWCSEPGVTWDWAGFGYNVMNDGGTPGGFGRVNTGFGQAYMRFSTGGDLYFYNVTSGAARSTTMQLSSGGSVIAFNSVQAPIFYDYNNTAYYCDPNGTSRMGTINADTLYSYGNVTAYSDERLKTDWENLPTDFVEKLAKVKSGTYTRVDSGERQTGVGAQSLQAVLKEAVSEKEQYLGVNYGNAALVSAVELAKYVTVLEQRIAQLEAMMRHE